MKKTLLTMALVLATGGAQAIPLSQLLLPASSTCPNCGSITAGDKLFDNWTEIFNERSDANGVSAINTANIDVTALNDGGDNPGPGLAFSILNGEFDVTGDNFFAYLDYQFRFKVTVLDPSKKVKDNSLKLTGGQITGSGDNGFYIKEKIGTAAGLNDLGEKEVEFSWLDTTPPGGDGLTSNLFDSAAFLPQDEIWVTKNILVWATSDQELASLQGFEQRFSQVPEPATLALFGLGLLGLGFARRRA